MKRPALLAALIGLFLILVLASAAPAFAESLPIIPLSDVKPGMKGIARTVVKGTGVSEFNVEVLDVVNAPELARGIENIILIKASGDLIDQTGGIAEGMSGSPVIIDGKVVGAISLSMGILTDEAIGGVTPIEDMLKVDTTPTAVSTSTVGIKPITIAGQTFSRLRIAPTFAAASEQSQAHPGTLTLYPPQIPLCCTGITRRQIKDKLDSDLSKYNMKLVPGSNQSVQPTPPLGPGSSRHSQGEV
ncbi:MAG: SpoIVB peptidase S55 domain-containing protein [Candidatus Aquicultor sp.]